MTLRRIGVAAAVVLAGLLGLALLWPDGAAVNRAVVAVYVFFLERGMPQAVLPEHYAGLLNVLAFVPLGWLGVVALHRRVRTTVLALAGLSVLAELAQLLPVVHREPSLTDVVANTTGALAGALLGSLARDEPRGDEVAQEAEDVAGDDVG